MVQDKVEHFLLGSHFCPYCPELPVDLSDLLVHQFEFLPMILLRLADSSQLGMCGIIGCVFERRNASLDLLNSAFVSDIIRLEDGVDTPAGSTHGVPFDGFLQEHNDVGIQTRYRCCYEAGRVELAVKVRLREGITHENEALGNL